MKTTQAFTCRIPIDLYRELKLAIIDGPYRSTQEAIIAGIRMVIASIRHD